MAIMQVPVVGGGSVEVDTDAIPTRVYEAIVAAGLKAIINGGASKITKAAFAKEDNPDEAYREARQANANKRLASMLDDSIVIRGAAKAKKATGAVMTEARRIARNLVKDAIKANNGKVSHYASSEITAAANQLIEADPTILDQAKAALEERSKTPVAIDVMALIHEDPKLVAKAESEKAKKRDTLSAKQAGKVKHREAPQATA